MIVGAIWRGGVVRRGGVHGAWAPDLEGRPVSLQCRVHGECADNNLSQSKADDEQMCGRVPSAICVGGAKGGLPDRSYSFRPGSTWVRRRRVVNWFSTRRFQKQAIIPEQML